MPTKVKKNGLKLGCFFFGGEIDINWLIICIDINVDCLLLSGD